MEAKTCRSGRWAPVRLTKVMAIRALLLALPISTSAVPAHSATLHGFDAREAVEDPAAVGHRKRSGADGTLVLLNAGNVGASAVGPESLGLQLSTLWSDVVDGERRPSRLNLSVDALRKSSVYGTLGFSRSFQGWNPIDVSERISMTEAVTVVYGAGRPHDGGIRSFSTTGLELSAQAVPYDRIGCMEARVLARIDSVDVEGDARREGVPLGVDELMQKGVDLSVHAGGAVSIADRVGCDGPPPDGTQTSGFAYSVSANLGIGQQRNRFPGASASHLHRSLGLSGRGTYIEYLGPGFNENSLLLRLDGYVKYSTATAPGVSTFASGRSRIAPSLSAFEPIELESDSGAVMGVRVLQPFDEIGSVSARGSFAWLGAGAAIAHQGSQSRAYSGALLSSPSGSWRDVMSVELGSVFVFTPAGSPSTTVSVVIAAPLRGRRVSDRSDDGVKLLVALSVPLH